MWNLRHPLHFVFAKESARYERWILYTSTSLSLHTSLLNLLILSQACSSL